MSEQTETEEGTGEVFKEQVLEDSGTTENPGFSEELVSDFDECHILTHMNEEVDVEVGMEIHRYTVDSIESPSCFIAKLDWSGGKSYVNWREAFNAFYSNKEASYQYTVRTRTPIRNRCYACLDPLMHTWERVRLLEFESFESSARVLFCDNLDIRTVPVHNLRELIPPFAKFPACTFYSSLADIVPISEDGKEQIEWTPEAVKFFKNFVKGKSFKTLVVGQKGYLSIGAGNVDYHVPYFGVIMISKSTYGKVTLQSELIKNGFAFPNGPFSSFPGILDIVYVEDYIASAPWKNSMHSRNIGCSSRTIFRDGRFYDKIAILKTIYNFKNRTKSLLSEIEKECESGNKKLEDEKCAEQDSLKLNLEFEEVEILAGVLENVMSRWPKSFTIPTEFQKCLGLVKISHVISPSWIYVHFWSRIKKLKEMETSLGQLVEKFPHIPFQEDRDGISIATFQEDSEYGEGGWRRAVVMAYLPESSLLKVLLIDYGQEISVFYKNSRYLPFDYQIIPSFAHRVFLNFTHFIPSCGPSWDEESSNVFRQHVNTEEEENVTCYLQLRRESSAFALSSFYQEMICKDGKWIPGEVPQKSSYEEEMIKVLDTHKRQPMLMNFYTTFGVELFHHVVDNPDRFALKLVLLDGSLKKNGKLIDKRDL